jgi:hypothetical protein
VANMRFKWAMTEKYHATLTGPPLLPFLPLTFTGSFQLSKLSQPSFIRLYWRNPHLGKIVKILIITTEHTIVLTCMIFFQLLNPKNNILSSLSQRQTWPLDFP